MKSKNTSIKSRQNMEGGGQGKKPGTIGPQNNQKTISIMAIVSPYVSTITLNINRLNSQIKRYRMVEWI